jgi:putative transposase
LPAVPPFNLRAREVPNYRRAREGNTYFFTVVTYRRRPILCLERSRKVLREIILREVLSIHPFSVQAFVLLPDHLHCIWRLPKGDADYSLRWALIKKGFTKRAKKWLDHPVRTASQRERNEGGIWQRRFWEHMIQDDPDFVRTVEYIHYNPVKHGWARAPKDWPYSTFGRYVDKGLYPADWGASPIEFPDNVGHE